MTSSTMRRGGKIACAIVPLLLLILSSLSPLLLSEEGAQYRLEKGQDVAQSSSNVSWIGQTQPWGQYARTPTHNGTMPPHGPDGGPGEGSVNDVSVYGSIDSPVVNWVGFEMASMHTVQSLLIFHKALLRPALHRNDVAKVNCLALLCPKTAGKVRLLFSLAMMQKQLGK